MGESENEGNLYECLIGLGTKFSLERVVVRVRVILAGEDFSNAEMDEGGLAGAGAGGKDEVNSREE